MRKVIFKTIIVSIVLIMLSSCAEQIQESALAQVPAESACIPDTARFQVKNASVSLLTKWNGDCGGASSEDGYYYPIINEDGSFNITYIDYATQQELMLCAAPACTHTTESCTSWLPAGQGGLVPVVVGNQLLLISRGKNIGAGVQCRAQIITMEPNGTNRKTLVKFDSADEILPPFAGNESTLFCIQQTTLKSAEMQSSLLAIDLTTGQSSKVQEFGQQTIAIVGAFDKNIVLKKTVIQDLSAHYTLLRYHTDTNVLEELTQWNNFNRISFVADSGYGFMEQDGTITYCDLKSGMESKTLANVEFPLDEQYGLEMVDFVDTYDDKVIFRSVYMGKEPADRRDTYYGISLHEGTMCELSLKSSFENNEKALEIIDKLDSRLLVVESIDRKDKAMVGDGGVPVTMQVLCNQYALISKDDYWNSVANYTSIQGLWF